MAGRRLNRQNHGTLRICGISDENFILLLQLNGEWSGMILTWKHSYSFEMGTISEINWGNETEKYIAIIVNELNINRKYES